ncbi:uncharacterized protein with SCP/PR1 domains [Burkholderiales bacterium JOSHI_001]|nr:uncharacterized protein with SCP/PR1 domains [Burkholderiales bacterium JOSHI_001]
MRFAWHSLHRFVALTLALAAGTALANDCTAPFTPAQAEAALNAWRARGARCGLKSMPAAAPLKWDARLAQAAQTQALDMARRRQLTHAGSDGGHASDRLAQAGYEWGAVAENIARGQSDLPAVMGAWARSAGHCRNAMEPKFQHMGLACVQADEKAPPFWTLVLAAPLR